MPLVNKTFSDIITFSRASSATMFDSSGTLVYAPMNLLTYSEDLSTAWSLADGTVTANSWTAPTGEVTGDIYTVGTNAAVPAQFVTVTSSTTYTLSFYYDKTLTTAAFFRLRFGVDGSSVSAWVDTANNTFGALNAQLSGGVVTDVGNNIYRVSLQIAYGATDGGSRSVAIAGVTANSGTTADTGNDLAIWGAQFNIANMQGGVTGDLSTYYPTTSAAYQGPRLDYDPATLAARGLLIEEQRTNSIRNNTMQGAVAGTPGTLPTNWSGATGGLTGITQQIVGTGTESGITYLDIRFSGTPSAAGTYRIYTEGTVNIAALTGQAWSNSQYLKLAAGTLTGVTGFTDVYQEFTSAGAFVTEAGVVTSSPTTSALASQRSATSRTLAGGATVAFVRSGLQLTLSGVAIDITLRIGLPQLELGAFATSVIPTTTTALTRSVDVASVNTLSPWYNSSQGTLYAEVGYQQNNPSSAQHAASFNDTTSNNRWTASFTQTSSFGLALRNTSGAGLIQTQTANSATVGATNKIALAISTGASLVLNGGTVATNASYAAPTVTQLELGRQLAAGYFNGHLRRITYYPRAFSSAELQAITA